MKKLLFILLITIPFVGFGQSFEKTFGGTDEDLGYSVQQTTDGGYIITGSTCSFGNGDWDVYLIKTDSSGNELWYKTFGGTGREKGYSVQQTTDGGYIITGSTNPTIFGEEDIYLIKTDGSGNELWNKTFGGASEEIGYSVQQTNDGGYIVTGVTYYVGNGYDIYLIKTDDSGNELWNKTFGGTQDDESYSVQQTTDGGYIVCGRTKSFGNGYSEIYLIKTDVNGDSLWTKVLGGVISERGYSVQQTNDGGYIIVGYSNSYGNGLLHDCYLLKVDGNGDQQWDQVFTQSHESSGNSVQQTTDGGYIICGMKRSNTNGVPDVFLIKTDGNGIEQWNKTFGGNDGDEGRSVQQTNDGGYIIVGWTESFGNGYDVFLIKTDDSGNITSTFSIPNPSSNRKLDKVINLLGRETKPQKNTPFIEIYDDGSTEKKIVIE